MKNKVGLALSGGGYRATAFHLGTFRKLKELGLLDKVDVISTISGGSITGAYYALNDGDFENFEQGLRKALGKSSLLTVKLYLFLVILPIIILSLFFLDPNWLSVLWIAIVVFILAKYQFTIIPASSFIENRYRKLFFGKHTLKDLTKNTTVVINSTNIESSRQFSFSRKKMSDSWYSHPEDGSAPVSFNHEKFPVSKAVMASTCVPFAFTPVKISKKYNNGKNSRGKIKPLLIDGGVYDNQGIHKLTQENSLYYCAETIIVSDAGTGYKPWLKNNLVSLLIKTSDLFMNRIKNIQYIQNQVKNRYLDNREVAYFSLWFKPDEAIRYFVRFLKDELAVDSVIKAHGLTREMIASKTREELAAIIKESIGFEKLAQNFPTDEEFIIANNVGTNLAPLKKDEINSLVKVAESLTEVYLKLYCPKIFNGM
jgi:NTE family protein